MVWVYTAQVQVNTFRALYVVMITLSFACNLSSSEMVRQIIVDSGSLCVVMFCICPAENKYSARMSGPWLPVSQPP